MISRVNCMVGRYARWRVWGRIPWPVKEANKGIWSDSDLLDRLPCLSELDFIFCGGS